MGEKMNPLAEKWVATLPAFERWIFRQLYKFGLHDLGYKLFGFDTWYKSQPKD